MLPSPAAPSRRARPRDHLTAVCALLLAVPACSGEPEHAPVAPVAPPASAAPTPVSSASAAPPPSASAAVAPTTTAAASAAPAPASAPPGKLNVLLITIDSLRADMPWNGYGRDIAPALTAFEKTAVSYTRFYSISSYTAMSLGGFLSGRYPGEIERSGYFFSGHPDSVLMFPEVLQKAGVRTVTAHAHFYFDQKAGFRQGFDVYEIVPGLTADNKTDSNITSPQHLALAEKLLSDKANTDKTFFAWFHFLDPHDQYMAHEGIGPYGKSARDRYDGEVTFTDQHVGKLLAFVDQQPWGKDTAIIISADHGEAFGEHKMRRHGFELYEALVHVPLMIRAPGIKPRRIDTPRSAIDLAPTILELTGTPAEPTFRGKSIVPELYGKEAEARDVVVDLPRTSDNDRRRGLIHGKYKLLSFGDDDAYMLYDVVADPTEENDLKKKDKALFEEMKSLYKATGATIKDICPKHTEHLKDKKKHKKC
ncbi:MAG: sulfatase [Byssovorax sp.]